MRIISYAVLVLTVILAFYIVVNEWLAAGLHRRRHTGNVIGHGEDAPAHLLTWQDVERAAPADSARVLLLLLAARLSATQRLPAHGALTARELARAARLTDIADRERLGEVASAAEAHLYSQALTTSAGLSAVIARGRELFERLGDPGSRAQGESA